MSSSSNNKDDLVIVSYSDLINPSIDISEALHRAYGPGSLGVIAIRGIPNWESTWRASVTQHHSLITQSESVLKSLEDEKSLYNGGWSFGKEKLGDTPDLYKASFYFNPLSDDARPDLSEKYPWAYPKNRWPDKELPSLKPAAIQLGKLMYDIILALTAHIDKLGFQPLHETIKKGMKAKARMLYYYPLSEEDSKKAGEKPDGWIGWHNDSGFLTGLTPDIFLDHNTGKLLPSNPEPEVAGLWVATRSGSSRKVNIPSDCMAIQCGECLQITSGGQFVATPHCVAPPLRSPGISRACMPIFVDSEPDFRLNAPSNGGRDAVFENTIKQRVPPLADRWIDGQTFADFLGTTFKAYYSWTIQQQKKE